MPEEATHPDAGDALPDGAAGMDHSGAGARGLRCAVAVVPVIVAIMAVLGAVVVFRVLEPIENSPEAYAEHGRLIWRLGLVATAAALGAASLGWGHRERSVRRASRFAGWVLGANAVLWMAPVPFGVHRALTVGLVLIGAGLLLVSAIAPVLGGARRGSTLWEAWRSPAMALGAFAAASAAMLMLKAWSMGWAAAVD